MMKLGIDVGSVSAKFVVMDGADQVIESHYIRTKGQPVETVLTILEEILPRYAVDGFGLVATTGTGGKLVAELLGAQFINEVIAQAAGTAHFHPEVRTIIEIGGEDSKLTLLDREGEDEPPKVIDFAANGVCAAGTGSFLDQQASRMGIPVEQLGDVALQSVNPPRVAGRCSVFAKTDMIHLQQIGTPVPDVVAGLCFAMVRNFIGSIVGGRKVSQPVCFQGGVAANKCIRRAILELMQLDEHEFIVPQHFAVMGAIGAVLIVSEEAWDGTEKPVISLAIGGLTRMREYLTQRHYDFSSLSPLSSDDYPLYIEPVKCVANGKIEAYVGVDIGSISTNVVVIDRNVNVLARRYIMTAGRPIEAVKKGLYEVAQELGGDSVVIKGAGSTGSGRYMTGEFFGADVIRNEITSHAKAAVFMCPEVDTILEIGGQDAKYISLDHGAVVDFTMNKVCAAGTGSFLEEQAEKLSIAINEEFGEKALDSRQPLDLGERCTVFMESQLNFHKQKGAEKADLLGGLAYSIVKNYLNKVVEDRRIGNHILFQGGVAFNRAVKAAFESLLGKKVLVPPHHDVLGAVGVAMLAVEEMDAKGGQTNFKGFDLKDIKYNFSSFECHRCIDRCEIHKVIFGNEAPLFYGARCGRYDSPKKKQQRQSSTIPSLFDERYEALINAYPKDKPDIPNSKTVGISRALFFHELFPLWKAFFTELGFEVVISEPTNRHIIRQGVENIVEEPCLPIKVAHGHVLDLLEKGTDFLFLPVQCTMEKLTSGFDKSWNCPLTQGLPFTMRSSIQIEDKGPKVLSPVFHADRGRKWIKSAFLKLAREMGVSNRGLVMKAIATGFNALDSFNEWQYRRGQEILGQLKTDEKAVVVIGRPYNSCDPGLTLNLPAKLSELGILAIPLDFLPLKAYAGDVISAHPNMYWKSGQKILAAARMIANDPRLFGLYLTNFKCGPDSYLQKFFTKETEGKPFLTIEIDEHSADAGIITRCEAFLDTIHNANTRGVRKPISVSSFAPTYINGRTVYIPYMLDHGYIFAAAMRRCGMAAEALPMTDEMSLELGRKYTSGKECLPSIITTGDIVRKISSPGFDCHRAAFFMPGASGPCRFGQYNKLHRIVLDELGLEEIPILVFDQTRNFHQHVDSLGSSFRMLTWRGFVILDLMQKMLLEKRPYEVNKGEVDVVYQEWLEMLVELVEQGSDGFETFAGRLRDAFDAIKIDKSVRKPRIGLVGEIFVRSNQFANDFVVRKLEALGAECALPPFEEWVDYIDYERKWQYRLDGHWKKYAKQKLTELVQERAADKLRRHFDGSIKYFSRELPISDIIARGSTYLSDEIKGEAILSMGRAVEYVEHDFHGVVNIMPFGCMPGTITSSLLHQFRDKNGGFPMLNLIVDGTRDSGQEIRIEAFYHQCSEQKQRQD
ncbi:acyl-CoA dehydratase activase [Chloroflexota bacterium]